MSVGARRFLALLRGERMAARETGGPVKILYCIPSLDYGGAERQVALLAGAMAGRGHDVHLAVVRDGPLGVGLAATGARIHRVGERGNHDPRLLLRLLRLVAWLRPDVVQTTITQMDVLGGAAALLTRTPWVLREPSSAAMYPPHWKHVVRRQLARGARAVVSNSAEGDAYWRSTGARARHVVPNGIALAEIARARADEATIAVPTGRRLVLFAARMDDGKNAGTLVEALGCLAPALDFVALLCGDGPRRRALEARVAELGLTARVAFPGYVPDLWAVMKRADVLVSPSRFEGCPNVVLEAMACGCPLVVSDIAAHRAILDEGRAWLVAPDDPAAMAAAIRAALASGRATERTRAASARAEGWSVDAAATRYETIYRTLLRRVPAPR